MQTRELLIDTAERMFAERGIHGVSMREIGLAAGQRNNGVTQYHFGDKSGLVIAIFERRSAEVNARRLVLLEAALAEGRDSVRDLVEAFVVPLAEQVEQGHDYVRFMSRLQTDGHRDLLRSAEGDVSSAYERIGRLLRTATPSGAAARRVLEPLDPGDQHRDQRPRRLPSRCSSAPRRAVNCPSTASRPSS